MKQKVFAMHGLVLSDASGEEKKDLFTFSHSEYQGKYRI